MPDPKPGKVRTGSRSVIIRHKKGTMAIRKPSDAYIGEETLAEDRQNAAGSGTGHYTTQAAPRTGGTAMAATGLPSGGSRKQIRMSKVRVKKSAASPQAKRSAAMLYRKG